MSTFTIASLLCFAPTCICLLAILVIWDTEVEHLARAYDKQYRDRDFQRICSWRYGMSEAKAFLEKFFDAIESYKALPRDLKGKRDWMPILERLGAALALSFALGCLGFCLAIYYL